MDSSLLILVRPWQSCGAWIAVAGKTVPTAPTHPATPQGQKPPPGIRSERRYVWWAASQ